MKIKELNDYTDKKIFLEKDSNNREISIYTFKDCTLIGTSLFYPNILFKIGNDVYNPIKEKVMSLKDIDFYKEIKHSTTEYNSIDNDNNFFFVYNTDNYYHFVYDTLPYLISYNELKKSMPDLKLLMNYPNSNKKSFYNFVTEFLNLNGISENDIKIVNNNTLYKKIFVSTSYTHDFDSNVSPREEIFSFYAELKNKVNLTDNTPKKIYISRRSWLHGNTSNIGTDYTSRRKMVNEDELINFLTKQGFVEIFTELLTTEEKINLFANAEHVIGAMGGGLCNVLFSKKDCHLTAIVSPYFMDINNRFKYSFSNVKTTYWYDTKNTETTELKTYMRVKVDDIVGEITNINGDSVTISYSETPIAGWNNNVIYKTKIVSSKQCKKLDDGINSPWYVNWQNILTTTK